VLFLLLAGGSTGTAYPQTAPTGTVSALQGTVTLARQGRTLAVAYGMPVDTGDRVTTAARSQVTITLRSREHTQIDLLGGLLHSIVRFAPGNAPNYEVHTPNAVAAARGTNYNTDYQQGVERKEHPGCREFTGVAVFEGVVAVSNPKAAQPGSVTVTGGHQATVPCSLLPTTSVLSATTSTTTSTSISPSTIISGSILGGAVVGGGVIGGVGAGGGFGGGPEKPPTTSSQ
jgi:hypothetical protein